MPSGETAYRNTGLQDAGGRLLLGHFFNVLHARSAITLKHKADKSRAADSVLICRSVFTGLGKRKPRVPGGGAVGGRNGVREYKGFLAAWGRWATAANKLPRDRGVQEQAGTRLRLPPQPRVGLWLEPSPMLASALLRVGATWEFTSRNCRVQGTQCDRRVYHHQAGMSNLLLLPPSHSALAILSFKNIVLKLSLL